MRELRPRRQTFQKLSRLQPDLPRLENSTGTPVNLGNPAQRCALRRRIAEGALPPGIGAEGQGEAVSLYLEEPAPAPWRLATKMVRHLEQPEQGDERDAADHVAQSGPACGAARPLTADRWP